MIRTGSIGIDRALGGGWAPGSLYEVVGGPGSAKTTVGLHSVESAVRARKHVLWIDLNDGVRHMDNAPRVIVGQPRSAEEAFLMAEKACQWPDIDLVVVDPTQHLVRQAEIDGDEDFVPHPQREYRVELNQLKDAAATHGTTVLFVGQPRDKERQPVRGTGISEKVAYRVYLHADVVHQDATREIQVTIKDVPGKSTQYDVARFTVNPGLGIDQGLELARMAVDHALVGVRGHWYHVNGLSFNGINELARALNGDPHLFYQVDTTVRRELGFS